MEGVGARFGRSSTRYGGPATVFTGPVRKWKKKWSPIISNKHPQSTNAGTTSCLLLYKWTPYDNLNDSKKTKPELPTRRFKYIPGFASGSLDRDAERVRMFVADGGECLVAQSYAKNLGLYGERVGALSITAVLEEQKNESAEEVDAEDESNTSETKPEAAELDSKSDAFDEKPDINDAPDKENKDVKDNPQERQDLNESTLDLSLG